MGLITDRPDPVPPGRFSVWFVAWLRRPSSVLFGIVLALGLGASVLSVQQMRAWRAFAEPTADAMGVVRSGGALLGGGRRVRGDYLCYVSYEFSPPGGAKQRNWFLWEPGCGVSKGRPIHIKYVIAHPEINRLGGEDPSSSALFVWFAAGVMLVIAILVRSARDGG
jgi:hypothetical protein